MLTKRFYILGLPAVVLAAIMLTTLILVGCSALSSVPGNSSTSAEGTVAQLSEPALSAARLITPTVLYDVEVDRSLSTDPDAPTQFVLDRGTYLLTMTTTFEDPEYFSLVVPDGAMLESIVLNHFESDDSMSTVAWGIQNGGLFTTTAAVLPADAEWAGSIFFEGSDEQDDMNLLNKLRIQGDEPCFRRHILDGTYAIRTREIRLGEASYSLTLTVTDEPERTHFPIAATLSQEPLSCADIEWRHEELGPFTLLLPIDMIKEDVQGIDSFVGKYNREGMALSFDYGWYSGPLSGYCRLPDFREFEVELSGKPASTVFARYENEDPNDGFAYFAGLHVPDVVVYDYDDGFSVADALNVYINYNNPEERMLARCILESVRFPE